MKEVKEYVPFDGFYDLREYDIPKQDFLKLWRVQRFLYEVEQKRRAGHIHPQIAKVRDLSAQYQQILFQYTQK
jgi:hypothetical protein